MGRQIQFLMMPEDEDAFFDWLETTGDIVTLRERATEPGLHPLDRPFPPAQPVEERLLVLWQRGCSQAPNIRPSKSGWHFVDRTESEVVEFQRSAETEHGLEVGRLWAELSAFDSSGEATQPKGTEFVKWFEAQLRWLRKNFKKGDYGIYIGRRAAEWLDAGGTIA
jgi:hypothetical protein